MDMQELSLKEQTELVTVRSAADIRGAAEAFRDIAWAEVGLRVILSDNIANKKPLTDENGAILASEVFGWNAPGERWWTDPRLALTSQLPRACRYESEPFWVNAAGFHVHQPNPYLDAIDLLHFEKRSFCKASIVVPVHLPFCQIGIVCFVTADPGRADLSREFEQHADGLALLSHRFIAGCAKALRTRQWLPEDCQLSKREVECLRWASFGKTDREISMILKRSHATVRFHIQNAGEKLDAVNRSQTIFKAAQLGYLGSAA